MSGFHRWQAYIQSVAVIVACTLICWLIRLHFDPPNLIMIYLVGVMFIAIRLGRRASLVASLLSVGAFDFFFVPPYFTFVVSDTQYILTFILMLIVAITISSLAVQIRQQAATAQERERRTASLYAMSREFASSPDIDTLIRIAIHHISDIFQSEVIFLLPDAEGKLSPSLSDLREQGVAEWVYENGQAAGLSTDTLPAARGFYIPMRASQSIGGVVGVYPKDALRFRSADQVHLLETFVNQTMIAIERAKLASEAERARIEIETERLRNNLLSSISHDLRTPLASITGAASSLLENDVHLNAASRRELAQVAYEEAERLNQQIVNLLEMTRLESGAVQINKEWQPIEEVIGTTLNHLEVQIREHPVSVHLPSTIPLVPFDSLLIGQVLVNLLENATKYAPSGTPIEISAIAKTDYVVVHVADQGPGLPQGEEQRIFDKFYRAPSLNAHGSGLGLTICRSIVEAHGGHIWAANRPEGGAVFSFTLPIAGTPPEVKSEDDDTL